MKILDVTEFYSERGGGVRSHLTSKGHILCQLGHEHVVVAPGPRDEEVAAVAREGGRARVIRVRGPASPYDPTYHLFTRADQIRAICTQERPDILEIHSPYLAAAGALAARRRDFGARTMQWHSDSIDTYLGVLRGELVDLDGAPRSRGLGARLAAKVPRGAWAAGSAPFWALCRATSKRCDATLVASRSQAAKLEAHGLSRVVRRPFGIEHEIFTPRARSDAARARLAELAGVSPSAVLLVAVGRLAIEKQFARVLDAFAAVARGRDEIGLVVLGDGPERARLEARAGAGVGFAGFVRSREELAAFFASADALVHACPWETFGLSIAEAMSAGLPVVVPDEGGAAEMHDPASGETYRALDQDGFAAAMTRVIARVRSDDAPRMREAAVARARALPSVVDAMRAQLDIYRGLLG